LIIGVMGESGHTFFTFGFYKAKILCPHVKGQNERGGPVAPRP